MPIVLLVSLSHPEAQERSAGPDLTRYALVCALLLLAIFGIAYLFRRFLADNLRRRAAKRSLQVLDVLPLGGKQKLLVVRCYDRSFLLGMGEKEVRSIAELDVEAVAQADQPNEEEAPSRTFRATLEREVEPIDAQPAAPERPSTWDDGKGVLA